MRCAKCGGLIHLDEDCPECGIGYREMLEGISHEEMRRLFEKMEAEDCCGITDLDVSLLACELMNSSLLFLVRDLGDGKAGLVCMSVDRHKFVPLFTDIGECEKPLTNSWKQQLTLLEGGADGFVINPMGEVCFLEMEFLKQYFLDDE